MTQNWNDAWVEAGEEDHRYFHALLAVTLGAYAGAPAAGCFEGLGGSPAGASCRLGGSPADASRRRLPAGPQLTHCPTPPPRPRSALSAGCAAIGGLLYHWFAPGSADCSLNISIVTLSLILCLVLSLVTMHPRVSAGGRHSGGGGCR